MREITMLSVCARLANSEPLKDFHEIWCERYSIWMLS